MRWDRHGLRLADVPGAGIARRDTDTRSGNPAHDIRSGKFGGGGARPQRRPIPANTDPLAYSRMLDKVREAARTLDTVDEQAVQSFIDDRANAPEQVDIQNFMNMVTEQRKADLLDIIDTSMREAEPGERIRISAPPGLLRSYMRALGPDHVAEIMTRLEGMGHKKAEVNAFFDSRIKAVDEAKEKRKAVAASDLEEIPGVIVIPSDMGER